MGLGIGNNTSIPKVNTIHKTANKNFNIYQKTYTDSFSLNAENKSDIRKSYEKIKNQQGVIGKLWDGFKNIFGMKSGSKQVEELIKQAEKGEISQETAQQALEKYAVGQKMCLDVVADIASGIISMTAFALAVPTGGTSIATGLAIAAATGAGAKIGIKGGDAIATGKDYNSKDVLYDIATGAINGIMAPVTNGLGNCVTKTIGKKLGLEVIEQGGKQVAAEVAKQTAKQGLKSAILTQSVDVAGGSIVKRAAALGAGMAIDGALSGASDNMVRAALEGEDVIKAGAQGAVGGLILSPVIGGGFRLAGKAAGAVKGKIISDGISADTPIKQLSAHDIPDNINTASKVLQIDDAVSDAADNKISQGAAKSSVNKDIIDLTEVVDSVDSKQSRRAAAEAIPDELWEDHPGMDILRNKLFEEDTGAYELTDDYTSCRIFATDIGSAQTLNLPFDYDELCSLNIQNLTLATNKKGVRGSSIFSKTNKKFMPKLKELGIDTVIDLRAESNLDRSVQQCSRDGLGYVHFPIDYDQKLTVEQINSFKNNLACFFEAMDNGKFYIGCNEGTNRTDVAFGINYLLNPNETITPSFESKNPQKSLQMVKRFLNDILQKGKDGNYLYIDDEFIKKLGWQDLDSFIEEYTQRTKILNLSNVKQ